jgi:hypothetical protein
VDVRDLFNALPASPNGTRAITLETLALLM